MERKQFLFDENQQESNITSAQRRTISIDTSPVLNITHPLHKSLTRSFKHQESTIKKNQMQFRNLLQKELNHITLSGIMEDNRKVSIIKFSRNEQLRFVLNNNLSTTMFDKIKHYFGIKQFYSTSTIDHYKGLIKDYCRYYLDIRSDENRSQKELSKEWTNYLIKSN